MTCSRCGGWPGLRPIRRGELAGLRWADLNLVGRELTIREQVTVTDRRERVGPPKSMAGQRTLALDETTIEVFWAHWRATVKRRDGRPPAPTDPLFTGPDGRRLRPDWLTRRFQRLVRDLDLPPVRLHDIRHGAVSLAGAAGVPVKVMQHDARHSSAVTTVDIYQHVFAETAHAAVAETAALLMEHAKIRMRWDGASQAWKACEPAARKDGIQIDGCRAVSGGA
jgi:integrase